MQASAAVRGSSKLFWLTGTALVASVLVQVPSAAQQQALKTAGISNSTLSTSARMFDSPQAAAKTLIEAAGKFDVDQLVAIFGSAGEDLVFSGEYPQDRQRALDFAAQAQEKQSVTVDSKTKSRAFLLIGDEDWPFPVPIVKHGTKWAFDAQAGYQELLYRRIGSNELDAIAICRGYVEAQYDYAFRQRAGYDVNQYAQRIISSPGKQDGLAWQNADGSWGGPIGEKVAQAIEQGYSTGEPYHGYFFKVLTSQGPDAPLGAMNYVVEGAMIGGFALVAAPAEYGETGVNTFIVSNDGIVYQKDFGPATLEQFDRLDSFNPDMTWTPVPEEEE
jgi:Protein of unknown function (DUF2950)